MAAKVTFSLRIPARLKEEIAAEVERRRLYYAAGDLTLTDWWIAAARELLRKSAAGRKSKKAKSSPAVSQTDVED